MRYFYDCPIKALYMMKEFGVRVGRYEPTMGIIHKSEDAIFCGGDEFIEMDQQYIAGLLEYCIKEDCENNNIYIHPESESIFKPKGGDIGVYFKNNKMLFAQFTQLSTHPAITAWIEYKDNAYFVEQEVLITMRTNKHFFQPLTEE